MENSKINGLEERFSALHEFKPTAQSSISVQVEVTPSDMVQHYADALTKEFSRLSNAQLRQELMELGDEVFLKYLKTLIYLRVLHVKGELYGAMREYTTAYKTVAVPSLIYHVSLGIGEVRDNMYNIIFVPVYTIQAEDLLALEDLQAVSDLLLRLNSFSFQQGLPLGKEGELDFMAMSCVESQVRSYKESHPLYGFLASFVGQQQLNSITGGVSRIYYGSIDDYRLQLAELAKLE